MVARRHRFEAQQDELDQLRQIYQSLQSGSVHDAWRIVQLIRHRLGPAPILRSVRDGSRDHHWALPQPLFSPRMTSLDSRALAQAKTRVPARPWTTVAGDGMVSHLISLFFELEQPFLMHHVDAQVFLVEMVEADLETAEFCTPLLVNAICALSFVCRSGLVFNVTWLLTHHQFSSPYKVQSEAVEGGLQARFFDEARRLFDCEAGKASVPTAQALVIMYVYCSGAAQDRAGLAYRSAACEMYNRLRMGGIHFTYPGSRYDENSRKRLLSKAAWGLFCLETCVRIGKRSVPQFLQC